MLIYNHLSNLNQNLQLLIPWLQSLELSNPNGVINIDDCKHIFKGGKWNKKDSEK